MLILFTLLITISFFFPSLAFSASSVDLASYFSPPNTSCQNNMSSGETFSSRNENVPYNGQSGFVIQKSVDPRWYERFGYDNEYIYHYEDTTWATGNNQNVKCNGTSDEASFTLFNGHFGSSQNTASEAINHQSDIGMPWVKRNMSEGECFTSQGTVVGINKRTGEYCDTPYTGPGGGHTICAVRTGPVCLPSGLYSDNGLVLKITSGAGAGEEYIYDQKAGWIGFNGNYATSSNCLTSQDPTGACYMPQTIEPDFGDITCSDTQNQGPLRPFAYSNICKKPGNVPKPTKSYATTFTVSTHKDFHIDEIEDENKTVRCDGLYYPTYDWSAIISEDYSKTETPWVGFGKSLNEPLSESKYLTDYLEGTLYYDGNIKQTENYWSETGVTRKLFPEWYQDQLKCDFIKNSKRDYQITINVENYCVDVICSAVRGVQAFFGSNPNQLSKNLKSIKCPPIDTTERTNTWDFTDDFYLWPVVPMFTREDTPGQVTLTAQNPPGELSGVTEGFNNDAINKVTHTLSIPHVKRNYELSKTLYNYLLPSSLQNPTTLSKSTDETKSVIIASPNNRKTPEKNLVAAADPTGGIPTDDNCGIIIDPNNDFFIKSYNPKRNTCGIIADPNYLRVSYSIDGEPSQVACEHKATIGGEWGFANGNFNPTNISELFDGQPCRYRGPVPQNTFTVNITLRNATGSWSCGDINMSNTLTKDASGNWIAACGTIPPPPPPPVCGNLGKKIGNINIQGKLDPKDPDKLDNVSPSKRVQNLINRNAVPNDPMREAAVSDMRRECDECESVPFKDCYDTCHHTFHYSTEISSTLQLPYLEKIQKYTAKDDETGFLNLIKPGSLSGFKEADSKSNVEYGASGFEVEIAPSSGFVEFPYLQGVYDAQACVSQRLLLPANYAANVTCPLPITPIPTP